MDSNITVSPFSLNNSGEITKALVLQRAAGPVGWRMRDTTSGTEIRIVVNGANLDIDENTSIDADPEANPSWTNRFRMAIATGYITGAVASTTHMGLCPAGDGDANKFLDGTLTFSTPSAATIPAVRVRSNSNQSIANNAFTTLTFNTEDFDTDTMHNSITNNSRITCQTAGKYVVRGQATFAVNSTGQRFLQILKNGTSVEGRTSQDATNGAAHGQEVVAILDLAVGDYVQLQVYQNSGGSLNVSALSAYSPVFWAYKVG